MSARVYYTSLASSFQSNYKRSLNKHTSAIKFFEAHQIKPSTKHQDAKIPVFDYLTPHFIQSFLLYLFDYLS